MLPSDVITVLATAAGKALISRIASTGLDAFLDSVLDKAKITASTKERRRLKDFLEHRESTWNALLAQMKPADRRGILVVGPSGGGKTKIVDRITKRISADYSTESVDTHFTQLAGHITAVHDSPGQYAFAAPVWQAVKRYEPKILVIVVADGYLQTRGLGTTLKRPGKRKTYRKLETYLTASRAEEVEWVSTFNRLSESPRRHVQYALLVVNKSELWYPDCKQDYESGDFAQQLAAIVKKVAPRGQTCQVVPTYAEYTSFMGRQAPHPKFDAAGSTDAMRFLKLFLTGLLLDGKL